MSATHSFFRSTIGRKVVMAITGVILVGFVIGHMLGNLLVYVGPSALDGYAAFLRDILHGGGLWIARAVLLLAAALHIWAAVSITLDDRAARPVGYRKWEARESTYASRSMRWTGVFLLLFLVYHLLDFTIGTVNPGFEEGHVYRNLVASFRIVPVSIFYMVAMVLLFFHLRHGVWSMLRTLGLSHPRYDRLAHRFATAVAVVVVAGNISFPLAVLLGLVR